jgi:hypothetical protein
MIAGGNRGGSARERWRIRSAVRTEQPIRDVLEFYPEARILRERVARGEWTEIRTLLDGFTDEVDREWAVEALVDTPGIEYLLRRVIAAEPDTALPRALLGARMIVHGWEIRGGGVAATVSRGQFDTFHDLLRGAESLFLEVLAREPADLIAGYWRLVSARGLSLGQNEVLRRYAQFAVHHPHHHLAQGQVLQNLCPKWGGTWDAAWAHVTACAEAAPPASLSPVLVPLFHLERWVELARTEADGYFRRPDVHADVLRAAQRTVLHPEYRKRLGWVNVHGVFAACFALADDQPRAADQFAILDNKMSEGPWQHYFPKPVETYVAFRLRAQRQVAS